VYEATDTLLTNLTTRGFTNYNFFQNSGQFDGFQKELVSWKGLQNRRQYLPTKLRIGAAMVTKKLNIGAEVGH
jgi:hypothetical protein